MSASLLIDGPGMWAFNVELKKIIETSIGRTRQNEVVLQDPRVSSKHAIIYFQDGDWFFKDLGSSNGSMINGRKAELTKLNAGDVLRIGSSEILFKNKEQSSEEDWGKTVMKLNQHELALREALRKAEMSKNEENIVIPDLHIAEADQMENKSIGDSISPETDGSKESFSAQYEQELNAKEAEVQKKSNRAEDMLWVAEKFAEMVGHLARSGGKTKGEFYSKALEGLRDTLEMQNGFMMVPNKEKKRWVIEAWVGDNDEWTTFEKNHPVPLTVANDAYKSNEIISNVWGDHRKALDSSASLMSLNVQTYLAVPIHQNGKKAGLIYLDQRKQFRPIADREVYLVSKIGKYIVELEYN